MIEEHSHRSSPSETHIERLVLQRQELLLRNQELTNLLYAVVDLILDEDQAELHVKMGAAGRLRIEPDGDTVVITREVPQ